MVEIIKDIYHRVNRNNDNEVYAIINCLKLNTTQVWVLQLYNYSSRIFRDIFLLAIFDYHQQWEALLTVQTHSQ